MSEDRSAESVSISAARDVVHEIDALAASTGRSRNEIVDQALQQYLEANSWQTDRIKEGILAARDGRVRLAEDVFADISARHGWDR